MRTPLLFLFLSAFGIASSQYIKLDISKLKFKELNHYSFEIDSIVDARSIKQVVGYVHYKKPYLYKTAALKQDLMAVLNDKLKVGSSSKEYLKQLSFGGKPALS